MKVMSFFSEKGGVGKTTLTAMFASYLAYGRGENVYVMDFDSPTYHLSKMREMDLRLWNDPANMAFVRAIEKNLREPYKIGKAGKENGSNNGYTAREMEIIVASLSRQKNSGEGCYLLDFPGRFSPADPVYHIAAAGLMDMFVVPVDSDRQSITSAMLLWNVLHSDAFRRISRGYVPEMVVLWNRENASERNGNKDWYKNNEEMFASAGVPVLPVRVRDMLIMRRDPNTFGFLRSTMCWPAANVAIRAPYLPDLFADIRDRLYKIG